MPVGGQDAAQGIVAHDIMVPEAGQRMQADERVTQVSQNHVNILDRFAERLIRAHQRRKVYAGQHDIRAFRAQIQIDGIQDKGVRVNGA